MIFSRRSAIKVLVASAYSIAIPFTGFAAPSAHAHAASVQDDTVIVVRDATRESKCTLWRGDPTNVQSCPAGSVIWSYPLARSAAERAHLDYVVPDADPNITSRLVGAEKHNLHLRLTAGTPVASPVPGQSRTTDAARKIGVSPNVARSTGGQYTNQDGNAISYWVGWNPTPANTITSIVSSVKMYGCCTNWQEDDLIAGGTSWFDRHCMGLSATWTGQQGLPGTYPNGVEYENWTSTCGLLPHNANGYTNLSN